MVCSGEWRCKAAAETNRNAIQLSRDFARNKKRAKYFLFYKLTCCPVQSAEGTREEDRAVLAKDT